MLEDGEIAFLDGPLGEAFISDDFFLFNLAFSWLVFAGSASEVLDPKLNYFGEVKRTLISAATKEAFCEAHFFQPCNMAPFIIQ